MNLETQLTTLQNAADNLDGKWSNVSTAFANLASKLDNANTALTDIPAEQQERFAAASNACTNGVAASGGEVETAVEELMDACGTLKHDADTVSERILALGAATEALADSFREAVDGLDEQLQEHVTELEASLSDLAERLSDDGEELASGCEQALAALGGDLADHVNETWSAQFEEILGQSEERFEAAVDDLLATIKDVAEDIADSLKDSLKQVERNFREEGDACVQEITDEIRAVLESKAAAVALDMLQTTTIGATITQALSPYTPQLMVAKSAAPVVQSALDAMKMS